MNRKMTVEEITADEQGAGVLYESFLRFHEAHHPHDPVAPREAFYEQARKNPLSLESGDIISNIMGAATAKSSPPPITVEEICASLMKRAKEVNPLLVDAERLYLAIDVKARDVFIRDDDAIHDKMIEMRETLQTSKDALVNAKETIDKERAWRQQALDTISALQKQLDDKRIDKRIQLERETTMKECEAKALEIKAQALRELAEAKHELAQMRETKRRLKESVERERAKVTELEGLLKGSK